MIAIQVVLLAYVANKRTDGDEALAKLDEISSCNKNWIWK